ncbi:kinase-like protein [Trametes cingulata]|nr:kinase-like protein [Trametes cingulata]
MDGLERRAIERILPEFGLQLPFTGIVDTPSFRQRVPTLVELNGPAGAVDTNGEDRRDGLYSPALVPDGTSADFRADSQLSSPHADPMLDSFTPPESDIKTTMRETPDGSQIASIFNNADICILIGLGSTDCVEVLREHIRGVRTRGGTVAALGGVDGFYMSEATFHVEGALCEVVPKALAIGPYSHIREDGSVRTHFPGFSVTAGGHGESTSFAPQLTPDNKVPLHSKSYAVPTPPMKVRPAMTKIELMSMTDKEVVELCWNSPSLTDTPIGRRLWLSPVYMLAANMVVKIHSELKEAEVRSVNLVRERTTIPVPAIYRSFHYGSAFYMVMQYIRGDTLDSCWDDLSPWHKLRIAFTLRNYVRQMRRIRTPQIEQQVPGPITDDPSQPLPCYVPALGEYKVQAFTSYAHLRDWTNSRFHVAECLQRRRLQCRMFDDSEPLVFTHGDLYLRNMILGEDGRLWLIDFGCAGVYPRWFEAYGSRGEVLYPPAKLWTAARKIAIGEGYDEQENFAELCQLAFSHGLAIEKLEDGWEEMLRKEIPGV